MVDIVLLLVIFFMLTSNFNARDNALPLDLPRASSAVRDSAAVPTVSVDRSGQIFLEGRKVALTELEAALKPLATRSGGVVALRADERGNYGTVVGVIDAIKRAGGERLALGTRSQ
nr:biopolymer transporter ExbD [Deinococcus peraridilitoris]